MQSFVCGNNEEIAIPWNFTLEVSTQFLFEDTGEKPITAKLSSMVSRFHGLIVKEFMCKLPYINVDVTNE